MTVLQGRLADRDAWSAVGECPVEKTMALLGTKSAMLIMRGVLRHDPVRRLLAPRRCDQGGSRRAPVGSGGGRSAGAAA